MTQKNPDNSAGGLRGTGRPAPPGPPREDSDAARYLDLWERHLSLTATAGLKPRERDK